MTEDYSKRWAEITSKTVDEQTKIFLRAFVLEFQGKFDQVLTIGEAFKGYAPAEGRDTLHALSEFECHLFLEKRGETLTVTELRENLKSEIQLGKHHNVAFIEYLLYKYKKTLKQLFTPPPAGSVPAALLQALDKAIEAFQKTKAEERERQEEMKRLKEVTESTGGKRTLQGVTAQNKMENLQGQEFNKKFQELQALKVKKEAEKAIAEASTVDPYVEEQKRLEAEKKRKEEEDKKARDEARARLKARSAAFNQS